MTRTERTDRTADSLFSLRGGLAGGELREYSVDECRMSTSAWATLAGEALASRGSLHDHMSRS